MRINQEEMLSECAALLPVRNGGKFIERALAAIPDDIFVVIIDDNSTDKGMSIARHPRLHTIKSKEHIGVAGALNLGLHYILYSTDLKYIARVDVDDEYSPSRYMKQINYLVNNADIDLVGSWASTNPHREFKLPTSSTAVAWDMWFYCSLVHPSVMFKVSSLRRHNITYTLGSSCEDYELWLRTIANGHLRASNMAEDLVTLVKHGNNVSSKGHSDAHRIRYEALKTVGINSLEVAHCFGSLECLSLASMETLRDTLTALGTIKSMLQDIHWVDEKELELLYASRAQEIASLALRNHADPTFLFQISL